MNTKSIFIAVALSSTLIAVSTGAQEYDLFGSEEGGEQETAGSPLDEQGVPNQEPEQAPQDDEAGQGLQLTAGTIQAGGNISFEWDMIFPKQGDNFNSVILTLEPMAGYFIIDYLELVARVGYQGTFGDFGSNGLGFDVGAIYFPIDMSAAAIYVGGLLGLGLFWPETGPNWHQLGIEARGGALFPMNRFVALDVGLRFRVGIGLGDDSPHTVTLPIGYFGVQGFFDLD